MKLLKKAKTLVRLIFDKPGQIWLAAGQNGLLRWVPDQAYLRLVFRGEIGRKLDLDHPKTYNEKLQWIKLNDRKTIYTQYADKYAVRCIIAEKMGEEYLVPLYGVWQNPDEIEWEKLPQRFVLKCTHGSGSNIICSDKSTLNIAQAKAKLRMWLKEKPYWSSREWCYKDIQPQIICEEYLDAGNHMTPDDYKFMCFNGEPKLIQLHHDRFGNHTLSYYTPDWKKTDMKRIDEACSSDNAQKPENLDKMLEIATALSQDMYFARIDLYNIHGRIYFGEITLYPTGGFSTFANYEDDIRLGSWIHLPCD